MSARNGPPKDDRPPENREPINSFSGRHATPTATNCKGQLRRRRDASRRLPGGDPWHYEPLTVGYEPAARHLLALGLTPAPNVAAMREIWKANAESRRIVQIIVERWEVVA